MTIKTVKQKHSKQNRVKSTKSCTLSVDSLERTLIIPTWNITKVEY
jgi:hypothetical protein